MIHTNKNPTPLYVPYISVACLILRFGGKRSDKKNIKIIKTLNPYCAIRFPAFLIYDSGETVIQERRRERG